METQEMLEGQLERARKRGDRVMDLEADILKLRQQTNELSLVSFHCYSMFCLIPDYLSDKGYDKNYFSLAVKCLKAKLLFFCRISMQRTEN